jgi:hypothetical protein
MLRQPHCSVWMPLLLLLLTCVLLASLPTMSTFLAPSSSPSCTLFMASCSNRRTWTHGYTCQQTTAKCHAFSPVVSRASKCVRLIPSPPCPSHRLCRVALPGCPTPVSLHHTGSTPTKHAPCRQCTSTNSSSTRACAHAHTMITLPLLCTLPSLPPTPHNFCSHRLHSHPHPHQF